LSYRGTSASDIIPLSGEIVKFTVLICFVSTSTGATSRNTDDEQDRSDLRGTVEDCMSGWPYLEGGISEVLDAPA
jgi:hypothetical protein